MWFIVDCLPLFLVHRQKTKKKKSKLLILDWRRWLRVCWAFIFGLRLSIVRAKQWKHKNMKWWVSWSGKMEISKKKNETQHIQFDSVEKCREMGIVKSLLEWQSKRYSSSSQSSTTKANVLQHFERMRARKSLWNIHNLYTENIHNPSYRFYFMVVIVFVLRFWSISNFFIFNIYTYICMYST